MGRRACRDPSGTLVLLLCCSRTGSKTRSWRVDEEKGERQKRATSKSKSYRDSEGNLVACSCRLRAYSRIGHSRAVLARLSFAQVPARPFAPCWPCAGRAL